MRKKDVTFSKTCTVVQINDMNRPRNACRRRYEYNPQNGYKLHDKKLSANLRQISILLHPSDI